MHLKRKLEKTGTPPLLVADQWSADQREATKVGKVRSGENVNQAGEEKRQHLWLRSRNRKGIVLNLSARRRRCQ